MECLKQWIAARDNPYEGYGVPEYLIQADTIEDAWEKLRAVENPRAKTSKPTKRDFALFEVGTEVKVL